MQNTSRQLVDILRGSVRDFVPVDLIEFYLPTETELIPGNAVKRFANTKLVWYGWEYEQQAISRGATNRYIDERFNTVSLTFSNIDRRVGTWLSETTIAGYRVVIRAISRSVDGDSIVLFVGRCEKPFSVNNATINLTIKQDLGSINSELPARKFTHACPLKFKGTDCLGGQTTLQKTPAYNAAATCDKSWQQCLGYGNTDFFQGFRSTNVTGSFVLREMGSMGIPSKATKQWSSQDQTPINESVPMGLGRTQLELTPIASADTGQFLYGHWVAGEGPITKFLNTRNVTPGFAQRFEGQNSDGTSTGGGSYREHLGEYGNVDAQRSNSDFLGFVTYSGRAYIEGTIRGQNPDTGDPAPTIVSTIMWNPIPTPDGATRYDVIKWSDNPVDHVRYLLTHERGLQYPEEWIDDETAIETSKYCDEPLYDKTGGEDLVVAQNSDTTSDAFLNGRFRSTGLIDPLYWRGRFSEYPSAAERRPLITYFPTQNLVGYDDFGQPIYENVPPPTNLVPNEWFRKRYTANWHLRKGVKVADFLFKQLLPSFKGYLVTGADGRLQIRSERSAVQARSSGAVTTAMNTIDVYDGVQFKNLNLPVKWILVRNPESNLVRFTVRRVVDVNYVVAANNITIQAPSSGAEGMNCTIQGAQINTTSTTFTGGSESAQAYALITVNDGLTQNQTAGVRIDGVDVGAGGPIGDNLSAYGPNNWSAEIAAMIATNLNSNPNLKNVNGVALRDYIEAVWEPSNPRVVLFRSKLGTLILDSPFGIDHPAGDIVTHFHLPFSDGSDGQPPNIIKDTFEWPLGNRQSAYNQFQLTYQDSVQDSQSVAIVENDYDHQESTNQINKLDVPGGECVDNYHQADRLLLSARYKYRESDFFVQFQATGLAMLLEEGDLILVNHSSMPLYRNYLYRIEELSVSQDHRVSITARLYSDLQYPEQAVAKTITLNRSNAWQTAILGQVQNVGVTRVAGSGNTARVAFTFPDTVGEPRVRVLVQRRDPVTGEFTDEELVDTGLILTPDTNNQGIVEIPGIVSGSLIQFVPFTSTGIEGTPLTVNVPALPTDTGGSGGGGAALVDGDYGDITVSNTGLTWTIDDGAVTLAKMQSITDARLLGRAAGTSGAVQQISVSSLLSLTSGTLGFASQNANLVLAGPSSGSAATPTFRSLVANDIPNLSSLYQPLDSDLTAIAALTANGLLRKTAGTWAMDSNTYLTANQTITLSGDVTGSGTTSIATTIANNAVTLAKMATMATDSILGRATASTGNVEVLTALPFAFTGDVTRPADSNVQTIANDAVTTAKIINDAVTFAKVQNISSGKILGRITNSPATGDIEELSVGTGLTLANGQLRGGREVLTGNRTYYVGFLPGTAGTGGCTITNATPAVVNCTGSNLVADDPVVFSTTVALPSPLVAGQVYYVIAAGLTADSFRIATAPGGSAINTTSAGSGLHTVRTGKDTNTGIGTNSRTVALLTVQRAIDIVSSEIDVGGYVVTIEGVNGLYSESVFLNTWVGGGRVQLELNGGQIAGINIIGVLSGVFLIKGLKLRSVDNTGNLLNHTGVGTVLIGDNVIFGKTNTGNQINVASGGAYVKPNVIRLGSFTLGNAFGSSSSVRPDPIGGSQQTLNTAIVVGGHGLVINDPVTFIGSKTATSFTVSGSTITSAGHTFANGDQIAFSTAGQPTLPSPLVIGTRYFVVNVSGSTFQVSNTSGGSAITLTTSTMTGVRAFAGVPPSSGGTPLNVLQTYYVQNATPDEFAIATTKNAASPLSLSGGSDINIVFGTNRYTISGHAVNHIATNGSGAIARHVDQPNLPPVCVIDNSDMPSSISNSISAVDTATDTITINSHGLQNGDAVVFSTSPAPPTGVAANTLYYVYDVTTNTFTLRASATNRNASAAKVDITGNGTGATCSPRYANTTRFANATYLSFIYSQAVFSLGTVTAAGARYQVAGNSVIGVHGANANHFPGDAAGTTADGGIYMS